mmetsp:Transcript_156762/g.380750  ORF Transcript_156762/g.380750 Transcript_156762/m.380750 type:complete len:191 (-) Transcript_156762:125-697(-)
MARNAGPAALAALVVVAAVLAHAPTPAAAAPLPTVWHNCTLQNGGCRSLYYTPLKPTTLARHVLLCSGTLACQAARFDCSGVPAGGICEMRCTGTQSCESKRVSSPNSIEYKPAVLTCPPAPAEGGEASCVQTCSGYASCAMAQVKTCGAGECAVECSGTSSCGGFFFDDDCGAGPHSTCQLKCPGSHAC